MTLWAGEVVSGMTLDLRIRRPPRFEPPSMHSAPSRLHRWQGSVPAAPCPSLE